MRCSSPFHMHIHIYIYLYYIHFTTLCVCTCTVFFWSRYYGVRRCHSVYITLYLLKHVVLKYIHNTQYIYYQHTNISQDSIIIYIKYLCMYVCHVCVYCFIIPFPFFKNKMTIQRFHNFFHPFKFHVCNQMECVVICGLNQNNRKT